MKKPGILLAIVCLLAVLAGCGGKGGGGPYACTVYAFREDAAPLAGVVINFCTDTSCTPVVTGEDGAAVFTGPAAEYHVQIVQVPAGWQLAEGESEWTAGPLDRSFRLTFSGEVGP